jgi:putative Holliday junction resolvase
LEADIARSLGLDIGDRRIGVALSDPTAVLASPLTIIDRQDDLAAIDRQDDLAAIGAITSIIIEYSVRRVIVGLPRSMDGSLGKQAEKVQAFTRKLRSHTEVPILFRDERLTTVSARRLMREADTKRARKKSRDDAIAAALILQAYLDEG